MVGGVVIVLQNAGGLLLHDKVVEVVVEKVEVVELLPELRLAVHRLAQI